MRTRTVLVAVLLIGLVSCSDDPEPKVADPTESPSSTVSHTASPTPTETVPTATASAQDELATIKAFFAAVSASISTGDTAAFMGLASPDCDNCKVIAQNIEDAYANGGYILDGRWTVSSIDFHEQVDAGRVWKASVDTAKERWCDASGKVIKVVEPSFLTFDVLLHRRSGAWQLQELRLP